MEWIKTEYKKPEFAKICFVWCRLYGRFLATYEDIGAGRNNGVWRDWNNGDCGILPPIYWIQLPEPPEEITL